MGQTKPPKGAKPSKGEQTRARILEVAQRIVLAKGFSGTSIDEIIAEADITKGGFFYHFRGKADLARELMRQYLEDDDVFFRSTAEKADALSEDPLQRLLLFLKLLAQAMEELNDVHPGCLVASFTYESQQFDPEVRQLAADGLESWRHLFIERFQPVVEKYPMKIEVPLETLADMLTTILEGGIMVSRTMGDSTVLVDQLLQYRQYVRLLFGDAD